MHLWPLMRLGEHHPPRQIQESAELFFIFLKYGPKLHVISCDQLIHAEQLLDQSASGPWGSGPDPISIEVNYHIPNVIINIFRCTEFQIRDLLQSIGNLSSCVCLVLLMFHN